MDEAAPAIDSVATQGVVTTTCPFLTVVSEDAAFPKPMVNQSFTGRNHKRGVCSIPTALLNQFPSSTAYVPSLQHGNCCPDVALRNFAFRTP
jgi:hypothetical protein